MGNVAQESEAVSGLEFAAINGGTCTVAASAGSAVCPAEQEFRPKWKDHRRAIQVCFNADSLGSGGQSEIECATEDDRVRFAYIRIDGGAEDFGFDEKGGGVGPVQRFCRDDLTAMLKSAGVDAGEGARSGNAGGAHVSKSIVGAGIEGDLTHGCFPGSIGRAWAFAITWYVALVYDLKCSDGTPYVFIALSIYGVANADVVNDRQFLIRNRIFIRYEGR